MDAKIINAPTAYRVDEKQNFVHRLEDDGSSEIEPFASYVLSHLDRHSGQHVERDNMEVVFADWTPSQMAGAFVSAYDSPRYDQL